MMLVGPVRYAELAGGLPVTGGEVAYVHVRHRHQFRHRLFLALLSIATTAFEAISLGWVVGAMMPGLSGAGAPFVRRREANVGRHAVRSVSPGRHLQAGSITAAPAATRLQDVLMLSAFFLAASARFIIAGIWAGPGENLKPLFGAVSDRPVWRGVLSVMATAPFWYAGFDVIPQMMGEKRAPGSSP